MKRLWKGQKGFLPEKFHNPRSAVSVVSKTHTYAHTQQMAGDFMANQSSAWHKMLEIQHPRVGHCPLRSPWLIYIFFLCFNVSARLWGFQICRARVNVCISFNALKPVCLWSSQASIARYSGWQIAFTLWGKLFISCKYVDWANTHQHRLPEPTTDLPAFSPKPDVFPSLWKGMRGSNGEI